MLRDPRPGLRLDPAGVLRMACAALLALALGATSPAAQADLAADLPVGAGYAAWDLCTRTMQSGDDLARVREVYTAPAVQPLPLLWQIDYQAGAQVSVHASYEQLNIARTVVYRPGLGCTLVPPGTAASDLLDQPVPRSLVSLPATKLPWPYGEGPAESQRIKPGQLSLLKQAADTVFDESETPPNPQQNTIAFLVVKDGHLIYERYAPGYTQDQPQLGWSMTKSLTAMIAGVLAREGRLDLDATVLKRWAGTAKAGITWRRLLNMSSGLEWTEAYTGASDVGEMLFSQADQGGYAAAKPLAARPGTRFQYSTGDAAIAALGLREALGGSAQAAFDFYQRRLFVPLGIRDGLIEPDASGTFSGGARGVLRPRDWLRLGQLILNDGKWQGRTLIRKDFIDFMKKPAPLCANYGGSVWLYDDTLLPSGTPKDVVYFDGHLGQFLVLVPSRRLAVLRMGVSFDEDDTQLRVFEAATMLARGL